ncbi:hypothetical protein SY88_03960 [Clostridiales bacterium PH28_bin88]|nr:hypothetical protein SY88_03960 [Clostridiales bacterium PH28_bin88]
MSNSFLSQEEIDALLQQHSETATIEEPFDEHHSPELTGAEKDALGEIGNISMGSAATALSQLLNQRVTITTPRVSITTQPQLFASFSTPYIAVEVNFTRGLEGSNLLIIKVSDAYIIADLMMGGDGKNPVQELTELQLSAVGEAMNQMIGSAATSMSSIFQTAVSISPPAVEPIKFGEQHYHSPLVNGDAIVVVSFRMEIGDLIDSEIMQVMPLRVAKKEVDMLLRPSSPPLPASEDQPAKEPAPGPAQVSWDTRDYPPAVYDRGVDQPPPKNIDLILDVPLQISVVLGKTRKPIKDVLGLTPGTIVELEKLADEPVDILVNGTLIAHGEVVVINENFGVRITSIASAVERINNLRG